MMETTFKKKELQSITQIKTKIANYMFIFSTEKLMKPKDATKAVNVNYHTTYNWKETYDNNQKKKIVL